MKKQIIVKRRIDKRLLQLNKKGFLNGHTPFTSLLSFLAAFCAVLFNWRNIAFSNEKSANEGNVKYLGKVINHQWAKSSEFEEMFNLAIKNEFIRYKILKLAGKQPYSVIDLAKELVQPTDKVLEHIVYLKAKNLISLDSIEGFTPRYKSLSRGGG